MPIIAPSVCLPIPPTLVRSPETIVRLFSLKFLSLFLSWMDSFLGEKPVFSWKLCTNCVKSALMHSSKSWYVLPRLNRAILEGAGWEGETSMRQKRIDFGLF
jgi:hypothetical protein